MTAQGIAMGVVMQDDHERVTVLTADGRRETWSADRVFHRSQTRLAGDPAVVRPALAAFVDDVFRLQALVSLPDLWDVVADSREGLSLEYLADLSLGEASAPARASLACALALDRTYFRDNADGWYLPASREAVQASLIALQREAQETALVQRAAEVLTARLQASEVPIPRDGPGANGIAWLKALALGDIESRDGLRGIALLSRLDQGRGGPESAFHLLVRLGVFSEDEQLGLLRHRIRQDFSPEVLTNAEFLAREEQEPPHAPDWDEGPGPVAIDDPWTSDVDDALLLRTSGNQTTVHILISDAAGRVPPDSPVAREGLLRAATLYLPTGKIPMMPPVLSEQALSLSADAPRTMLDFCCTFADGDDAPQLQIRPVRARLGARLTYDEADRRIREPSDDPLDRMLVALSALSDRLRARRETLGAVRIDRDEVSVRVVEGRIRLATLSRESESRRLVSEFMVLACTEAGRFAMAHDIPIVYRRQAPPEDPTATAGLVPGTRAYAYRMVRSLRRAELTTQPALHFGLGVHGYTQVTSPIRRFQDYLSHIQIKGFLEQGRPPFDASDILRMFGDLESRVDTLVGVEREARRYWLMKALQECEGRVVDGEIVAVTGSRGIVNLDETGLDLPLPGAGHLAPGMRVKVRVIEVSPRQDRAVLAL